MRHRPRWRRGSTWSTLKIERYTDCFHVSGTPWTCLKCHFHLCRAVYCRFCDGELEHSRETCKLCYTPEITPESTPPSSPVNNE